MLVTSLIVLAEIEAKHLKTIAKEDLIKFYKEYIHINGSKRAKLMVHVLAKNLKDCKYLCIFANLPFLNKGVYCDM